MTVKIDRAGRIVVPKPVRDRLGLVPDSELELEEQADGFHVRPVVEESSWEMKDGILVHKGRAEHPIDVLKIIEEDREERIRHIIGDWK